MTTLDQKLKCQVIAGYCLWVGAGLPIHVSRSHGVRMPTWPELVTDLEGIGGLAPAHGSPLDKRLEMVRRQLGATRFQQEIRQRVLGELCRALVTSGRAAAEDLSDPIPRELRQLARLGMAANPIVSFNLEDLTSSLVAAGGGGGKVHDYDPRPRGTLPKAVGNLIPGYVRFRRGIYHPHGTISVNGPCVLTSTDYANHNGTLAFQLAAHAAFGSTLLIVGMSLEDEYLRAQLTQFRQWVGHILWFCEPLPSDELREWVEANEVEVYPVGSWDQFWESVGRALPKENDLTLAVWWQTVYRMALDEVTGRIGAASAISVMRARGAPEEDIQRLKEFWANRGQRVPPDKPTVSQYQPRDPTEAVLWRYARKQPGPWPKDEY